MTLSAEQVRRQVMDYLEATECSLIEVSPLHVTVKLSPRADRMLTDRPYYWGFVERTGVEPETLSFTFVFDPESYDAQAQPQGTPGRQAGANGSPGAPGGFAGGAPGGVAGGAPGGVAGGAPGGVAGEAPGGSAGEAPGGSAGGAPGIAGGNTGDSPGVISAANVGVAASGPPDGAAPQDTILGRYFGIVPALPRFGPGMIRREDVIYGSKRLRQIWTAARAEGECLCLFEAPGERQRSTLFSAAYEPWLGVCYKAEMTCDLKCEELHFVGISLVSGRVVPDFNAMLGQRELSPRLPENVHVQPYELSLTAGAERLEGYLTGKLAALDFAWADGARERLELELSIVDLYYAELLKEPDEEKRKEIEEQYNRRRQETTWQYEPQISVSAVIYGLFHLRST
ncbi:YqhG family protein [Paenibacillus tepidiphilus]|uniref:YqhG family protein n=1 Tax=Paenibacillus tepidiphilus TaxID=2608683 RepID=UPI001EF143C1|nr:YqhG family protein [Paenibacillus tepidiphilus]